MNKKITFNVPISKVDEEKRIVYGIATAEVLDKQGEIVDYEASKKAFGDWKGNIREMHRPDSAVGKKVHLEFDDANKAVIVGTYISRSADGENAWTKVKEGVLTGFSIGGTVKATTKEAHKGADGTETQAVRISNYDLSELSLVDNPACPVAEFLMVKSADGKLQETEKLVSKVPVDQPYWLKSFNFAPTQVKQSADVTYNENDMAKADKKAKAEKLAKDEPVVEPVADETKPEEQVDVKPEAPETSEEAEQTPEVQPEEAVEAVEEEPEVAPEAEEAPEAPVDEAKEDVAEEKSVKPEMTKDLYAVASLADAIACVAGIRDYLMFEKEVEGDNSPIPARLTEAVDNLGGVLQDMAAEEVQEAVDRNPIMAAAQPEDMQKKLEDIVTNATQSAVNKAAEQFTGKVEELVKPLTDRVERLERQPVTSNRPASSFVEVEKVNPAPPAAPVAQKVALEKRWEELKAEAAKRKHEPLSSFPMSDRHRLVDEMWKLRKQIDGNTIADLDPLSLIK